MRTFCAWLAAIGACIAAADADGRLRFALEVQSVTYDVNTALADEAASPRYCPEGDDPCPQAARPRVDLVLVADADPTATVSGEAHLVIMLSGNALLAEPARASDVGLRRGFRSAAVLSRATLSRGGEEGDRFIRFELQVADLTPGDELRITVPRLRGVRPLDTAGSVVEARVDVSGLETPAGDEVVVEAGKDSVTVLGTARAVSVAFLDRQGAVVVDIDDRRMLADSPAQVLPAGEQRIVLARAEVVTVVGLLHWDGTPADDAWAGVDLVATGTRGLPAIGDRMFLDYDGDGTADADEELAVGGGVHSLRLRLDAAAGVTVGDRTTYAWPLYYLPEGEEEFRFGATVTTSLEVRYRVETVVVEHLAVAFTAAFLYEGVTREVRAYAAPTTVDPSGDAAHLRITCEDSQPCLVFLECFTEDGYRYFGEIQPAIGGQATRTLDSRAIESTVALVEPGPGNLSCIVRADRDIALQLFVRSAAGTLSNLTYVSRAPPAPGSP